ncbi:unnamed protein product [Cuscuta campestris]|uniref:Reverse transcriptase domain-containing protein n=1 Tax=Cuscuta campestris TaxID=132261 RepID=A0A484MRY8_9ASTE|nr:unnamed protein product [Cuscuta campestris]
MLCAVPQEEEIRGAIWDLNSHSAPGPDGYNGTFFKTYWHIIHDEVTRATQEFFLGLPIPKSYGATLLTLIPKVDNPKSLGDYRPISLSTFLSKVNTKILANRLGSLLHKLISPEQSGFQAGKGVDENILLTQEMIHCLDNTSGSANIAIKLDFAKAFDRISWQFLEVTLSSFGFSSQSCHLLLSTLKVTHFSILINGTPHGFFKMKRGVKQGDPLSPLLFILGNEGLSRLIKGKVEEGSLKAIHTGRNHPPSHLAYADDIIFFLSGHFRNLLRFKGLLDCFLKSSGHLINLNKSHFYTGLRVKLDIKANMQRALHMREGKLPFTYLGATIGKGKVKKEDCKKIVQHFDVYLNTWHSKVLNQMGRLILIKHVLSSIPLHIVAVQQMPKSIHNILNKKMQNFLWGYKNGKPKYHWISWRGLCYPKHEGGLGIRHLEDVEAAYSTKLWWKIRNSQGLWGEYMRRRYRPDSFQERPTDTVTWKRAAKIHNWALQHVQEVDETDTWEGEPFTTKLAYHAWRDSKPISLAHKMIWNKLQIPKISLFMWKAFNNILPYPENFSRFNLALPSQCSFCLNGPQDLNHTLFQCQLSFRIWRFFSALFDGPIPSREDTLHDTCMKWWISTPWNKLQDKITSVLPGFIAWGLWKAHNEVKYAGKAFKEGTIIATIMKTIQQWIWIHKGKKWMHMDETLKSLGFRLHFNRNNSQCFSVL